MAVHVNNSKNQARGYDPQVIEAKWRNRWEAAHTHRTGEAPEKPKFYCLDMFPYPSGDGLHVGHWRGYVLSDVWSRYKRLCGFNVLHPMGWDAFGLPAENDALKKGIHPEVSTQRNIANFKRQLQEMGAMYDWDREVNTSDPEFYRFTQWIFIQMYKRGLAYQKEEPINWCPSCRTGLANEEVVNGRCERCEAEITKKPLKQWMLKITAYGDRLLEDLDTLVWPERVKKMQAHWIGRSQGAEIRFPLVGVEGEIGVFTTRADTLFGVTYLVLAPEHPLVAVVTTPEQQPAVAAYQRETMRKSSLERIAEGQGKTGVFTGGYAQNPINGEAVPIWISDYVLMDYGTGAIMAVPAHDSRDEAFARFFHLPIRQVITGDSPEVLVHSGPFTGLPWEQGREAIIDRLSGQGMARRQVNYKLRDWVFSRQRYWGEPIPIIHCPACGEVPVPEAELPVRLPMVERYEPSGTGESPLALMAAWVNTTCPQCGGPAKRETNTMPQWAGSSWYFLRYCDPHNREAVCQRQQADYWLPVDFYIGGNEHAILHLLYARFYTKFLYDIGVIGFQEPFTRLFNIGMINKDGYKMSKSKPNCISSDQIVRQYGADTLRLYEMFIGPPEQEAEWHETGIEGVYRLLCRVWSLALKSLDHASEPDQELERKTHQLIRGITHRIEKQKTNTAISLFMSHVQYISKAYPNGVDRESLSKLVLLLAPFVPHFAEEIWEAMGHSQSIFESGKWPEYDPELVQESIIEIPIQINGRVRERIWVEKEAAQEEILAQARESEGIRSQLEGRRVEKEIYIPGKIISFVVR